MRETRAEIFPAKGKSDARKATGSRNLHESLPLHFHVWQELVCSRSTVQFAPAKKESDAKIGGRGMNRFPFTFVLGERVQAREQQRRSPAKRESEPQD